ncbi:uncharacterized protein LOC107274841 [Cephus cinctus]|uniref:Uncharacterized protein LOC107274841 n=1 Tax=Cephus cinctus TaxID=211228 RepID=A0AAJ7CGA7_CEPCN|nr:uncharacterized protein LOC107274841 [Cephus cinctus]
MPPVILVDLESSGLGQDCDILQIAATCGSKTFATYVNPIQQISISATGANGLTNHFGDLMYFIPLSPLMSSHGISTIFSNLILGKILKKIKISKQILTKSAKDYCEQSQKWDDDNRIRNALPTLDQLKGVLSKDLLKKMAKASITVNSLKQTYGASGETDVTELLGQKINGKPVVTSHKLSLKQIFDWLQHNKNKTSHKQDVQILFCRLSYYHIIIL